MKDYSVKLKITRRGKPVNAITMIQQNGDIYTVIAYSKSGKPCVIEIVNNNKESK